jgi:hypothetical protein
MKCLTFEIKTTKSEQAGNIFFSRPNNTIHGRVSQLNNGFGPIKNERF